MEVFTGDAACAACHSGAEITDNSGRILMGAMVDGVKQPAEVVERMFNGNCEVVAYDQGVYNIGVRPIEEDLGMGSNDPFGNPLAFIKLLTPPPKPIPSKELLTLPIPNIANPPIAIGERTLTTGTFKVPSLRNLELDRAVLPQRRAGDDPPSRRVLQPRRRLPRAQRRVRRLRDRQAEPDRTADRRSGRVPGDGADRSSRRAAKRAVRPPAAVRSERARNARRSTCGRPGRNRNGSAPGDSGGWSQRRDAAGGFPRGKLS